MGLSIIVNLQPSSRMNFCEFTDLVCLFIPYTQISFHALETTSFVQPLWLDVAYGFDLVFRLS